VEVYKRETREVVRRFLLRQLSLPNTIAALDAALAGLVPHLQPEQLFEVRTVMLANNDLVMDEMASRSRQNTQKGEHGANHRYIDCKDCAARITLETYTGEPVFGNRLSEKLTCPSCHKESTYSGDDFRTAKLF
jgi:hypothetical protein